MKEIDDEFVACATCIHCIPKVRVFGLIKDYEFAKCRLAVKGSVWRDKVTGKEVDQRAYEYCSTARLWTSKDTYCGPDGKYWSPVNKKDLFKQVKRAGNIPNNDILEISSLANKYARPPKNP
jgi:hypothetical protein